MTDLNSEEYQVYVADVQSDNLGMVASHRYLPTLVEWMPGFDFVNARILEVGASVFTCYDWFVEHFNNPIYGMDFAPYLLQHQAGSPWCKPWDQTKKEHYKCPIDAHRLAEHYEPDNFDLVISFHALEHMFDLPLVLSNCFTILKPGGWLFCSLPSPSRNLRKGHWYDVASPEAMRQLCEATGFRWEKDWLVKDYRFRPEREMICLFQK